MIASLRPWSELRESLGRLTVGDLARRPHWCHKRRMIDPNQLTLRVHEVAALVGIGQRTVWKFVRSGDFPKPFKIGSRTFWKRRDIELFIESAGSMAAFRRNKRGG